MKEVIFFGKCIYTFHIGNEIRKLTSYIGLSGVTHVFAHGEKAASFTFHRKKFFFDIKGEGVLNKKHTARLNFFKNMEASNNRKFFYFEDEFLLNYGKDFITLNNIVTDQDTLLNVMLALIWLPIIYKRRNYVTKSNPSAQSEFFLVKLIMTGWPNSLELEIVSSNMQQLIFSS